MMKYNDFCKSCQHRIDSFLRVCCKARGRKVLKVNPPNLINNSYILSQKENSQKIGLRVRAAAVIVSIIPAERVGK